MFPVRMTRMMGDAVPIYVPRYMGVSENRGPKYSTLNSRILIVRTPNEVPLIFGNSHMHAYIHACDWTYSVSAWLVQVTSMCESTHVVDMSLVLLSCDHSSPRCTAQLVALRGYLSRDLSFDVIPMLNSVSRVGRNIRGPTLAPTRPG